MLIFYLSKHHGITIWYKHFAIDTLLYCKELRLKKHLWSEAKVSSTSFNTKGHKKPLQKWPRHNEACWVHDRKSMIKENELKTKVNVSASGSQASERRLQYTSTTTSCRSRFTERMLTAEKQPTAFIEVDIKSVKCFISSLSKTRNEQIDLSVSKLLSKQVVMLWLRELIEAVTFTAFMWRFELLLMAVPLLTRLRELLN